MKKIIRREFEFEKIIYIISIRKKKKNQKPISFNRGVSGEKKNRKSSSDMRNILAKPPLSVSKLKTRHDQQTVCSGRDG